MPEDNPPPPSEHLKVVAAICEVCGWQIEMIGWGRVGKLSKAIRASGGTAAELLEHYGQTDAGNPWWWYRDHWLGKRGERPDDGWIRKTWGAWNLPIAVQPSSEPAGFDSLRKFLGVEHGAD